jgi:hypothetical protein
VLKQRPWLIAFATFVTTTIGYYGWISIFGPYFTQVCAKGEYGPPDQCSYWDAVTATIIKSFLFLDEHAGIVSAFAGLAVAIFTGVLWVVTGRAADAARAAADALPIVERAYVYPVIISVGPIRDMINRATVYYLGDIDKLDTPANEMSDLSFCIKNFGKTPAIIKGVYASWGVIPLKGFGAFIGRAVPESILGADGETSSIHIEMLQGITPNEARWIVDHTRTLAFEGIITFDDIWGVEYETRFLFRWDGEIEKMVLADIRSNRTTLN